VQALQKREEFVGMGIKYSDEEVLNKLRYMLGKMGDEAALRLLPHTSPDGRRKMLEKIEIRARQAGVPI
jgi:hypothetical protein